MALPTVEGTPTTAVVDGSNTGDDVAVPTGATSGDVFIIHVQSFGGSVGDHATSSGFVEIGYGDISSATDMTATILAKEDAGDSGNFTVSQPSNTYLVTSCFYVRGADVSGTNLANLLDATSTQAEGTSANMTIPAITTVTDDCLILDFGASSDGEITDVPTGGTEIYSDDGGFSEAWEQNKVTAGTVAADTAVGLSASTIWIGQRCAIAPNVAATSELEGFRFEKDDVAEAGAWWAAQDTNPIDVDAPFGLRVATVFTNDPGSASFKIAGYRRVGDADWDGDDL